ncbi:MAG: EamA family transporter [Chitinophagaceae bacterium]
MSSTPSRALILAAFAALYIIWGSTYTAILLALESFPPFMMAGIRFVIAGLLLYVFFRVRGEATPGLAAIGQISVGGLLMLFIGTGSVAWVEQYITSGLAAIIVASTPLWFVLLDRREWKANFSNRWVLAGLLIGFAGVLTLFADGANLNFEGDRIKLLSVFVLLAGTVSWAIGSLYSKYRKIESPTGMKASFQMLSAGAMSLLVSFLSGEMNSFDSGHITWQAIAGLAYLIVFGSLIGFMAYVWLLSVRSATLVGTYAYVNPVVAVFLGWVVADEMISSLQVLALAIILGGVILVGLAKSRIRN